MEIRYGPNTDGARINPEKSDTGTLRATAQAAYQLGTAVGAHERGTELHQPILDAQSAALELVGYTNMDLDEGVFVPVSTIFAAAMACSLHAEMSGDDDDVREAAETWEGVAAEIVQFTDTDARKAVLRDKRDGPDDPWDMG